MDCLGLYSELLKKTGHVERLSGYYADRAGQRVPVRVYHVGRAGNVISARSGHRPHICVNLLSRRLVVLKCEVKLVRLVDAAAGRIYVEGHRHVFRVIPELFRQGQDPLLVVAVALLLDCALHVDFRDVGFAAAFPCRRFCPSGAGGSVFLTEFPYV